MNVRPIRALCLSAALLIVAVPASATPPPAFVESVGYAADYHRAISLVDLIHPDPVDAAAERERLTHETLAAHRSVEVLPCFATWWSHEYMGLQLSALAMGMSSDDAVATAEAAIVEQLGKQMWLEAAALFPLAAERCEKAGAPDASQPGLVTSPVSKLLTSSSRALIDSTNLAPSSPSTIR